MRVTAFNLIIHCLDTKEIHGRYININTEESIETIVKSLDSLDHKKMTNYCVIYGLPKSGKNDILKIRIKSLLTKESK